MTRLLQVLGGGTVVAVVAATAGMAAAAPAATPRTITVAGTGIVMSVPTQAVFTFGVSTTGKTATEAMAANAAALTKVIGALKAQGVSSAGIQTAELQLSPNTNQTGSTILNYTAMDSVTARLKTIAKAGPAIDAAVRAGANLVSGPALTSADTSLLSRQALKAAIADARTRARAAAAAAGVRLGRVRSVSEVSSSVPLPESALAKSGVSTPVQPGTIQTEVDVAVTFDIA
jgi:uncharacterized protein YggE